MPTNGEFPPAERTMLDVMNEQFARGVRKGMERAAEIAEAECLDIGCTALEAEGVVRRTRDAIAKAIRAAGQPSSTP